MPLHKDKAPLTRLFWVRHGPTHAKGLVGWSDLPADLSDTAQIARLDAHLPTQARLVSSDLSRAVTTADALARSRYRLPHDRDLREMHFGAWELKTPGQIDDPDRYRAFWDSPGDVRPPSGESWHTLSARVSAATDRLVADHTGADIVIVAHLGAILSQVQRATGLPTPTLFAQRLDNLSVTELHHHPRGWHVERINHLP